MDLFTPQSSSPSVPGPLKLVALIDPTTSAPFTSRNLMSSLAKQPFVLFSAWSKILYNAWILHYVKRLDVFARPDPQPAVSQWLPMDEDRETSGGVGWQQETWAEAFARKRVEEFLRNRVEVLGVDVMLRPANPAVSTRHFTPSGSNDRKDVRTLTVSHLSSTFFSTLFLAPSAGHALRMGKQEKAFAVSSEDLFLQVFSDSSSEKDVKREDMSFAQRLRLRQIPSSCESISHLPIPNAHPLDSNGTFTYLSVVFMLLYISVLDRLEKFLYTSLNARFVSGQEPWSSRAWERSVGHGDAMDSYLDGDVVQREGEEAYMLGSVRRIQ